MKCLIIIYKKNEKINKKSLFNSQYSHAIIYMYSYMYNIFLKKRNLQAGITKITEYISAKKLVHFSISVYDILICKKNAFKTCSHLQFEISTTRKIIKP